MFLRSLSMKGFKSFADPTVLEFEPGITVVVGPNGSGKSNVVDAVAWVLGAQGPRSLRSQKMEDVIFAGTSSRPALGRAEVSLTIDNASGKLPVDMAEVTITRTLFRTGDSEYAINGTPCRLLDIQELLSDSGVGRQQHMIIGQGQLDTVLNARPEERRAIIEEAAGVLKHRRRRERAERRLASTQENLERLGDLVREVRRQIRPLERQAAAARSHTALAEELLAVRRHLAGRELATLAERQRTAETARAGLITQEAELAATLAELDEAARTTAAELSSRRQEDLATALGRVQGLVERARGLIGVLRERSRSLAAALDAAADVDVVSTLEAEGSRLAGELESTEPEAVELEPERVALAAEDDALSADEQASAERWGDGRQAAQAEERVARAHSRLEVLRRAAADQARNLADLDERLAVLARRVQAMDAAVDDQARREAELAAEAEAATAAEAGAEAEHRAAAARAEAAERSAREAEEVRHKTAARAEALARTLRELEGAGGREALAGVSGVVGALVDLVDIDQGWESAFEAAAGALVSAVVVDGGGAARQALRRLAEQGATGTVVAAGALAPGAVGPATGVPVGAEPLRDRVRPRPGTWPGMVGVLDLILASAVRVAGWEAAADLSLARPDLVVVTPSGDRFAASGWRVRSSSGVVTPAAVEQAEAQAAEAADGADRAGAELVAARAALESARQAVADAGRARDRAESTRTTLGRELARAREEHDRLAAELEASRRSRVEAGTVREADVAALAELEASVPELEAERDRAVAREAQAQAERALLAERRADLTRRRHDAEVRAAGLSERRRVLAERLAEVERRLQGHAEERQVAAARRQRLEADGRALGRLEAVVDGERVRAEELLGALQGEYRDQLEAVRAGGARLEDLRERRAATEGRLNDARDRSRALEVEVAEVGLRTDTLGDLVRRELGCRPEDLAETPEPELPAGTTAEARAAELTDRLAALGPVNPLALEELSVLEERHRDLETQVADVRSARRELQEVVRALDEEIMTTFAAAAADVNEHFSTLVAMLFPGGTGRLALTEPDDLLNTGVEVEVRPMGRNVRRVSLLSGGERSLAALAFLFAVFRSRPSPFYLMDEVEAALDDVNLHRFLGLVREFRAEAQLIVVSHQKRTMETGDALYGVTMAPGGSSQVVSQKVERQAEAVPG